MAAKALQVKNAGSYAALIGNLVTSALHSIQVEIKAGGNPEAITRIAASYADDSFDAPYVCGRLLVLKSPVVKPDDFLDPNGIDPGSSMPDLSVIELDQGIHEKGMKDFLRQGDAIIVPAGQIYIVYLTSAYSQGDVNFRPKDKRAKLLVKTTTLTERNTKLHTY